jgi:hypothetical protein
MRTCGVAFVSKSQPSANGWAADSRLGQHMRTCGVVFMSKSQPSANGLRGFRVLGGASHRCASACGVAFGHKSLVVHYEAAELTVQQLGASRVAGRLEQLLDVESRCPRAQVRIVHRAPADAKHRHDVAPLLF